MPRKILRRLLPKINEATKKSKVKWLRTLASDPNLLQINRHSVSIAVFIGVFTAFLPIPEDHIGNYYVLMEPCKFAHSSVDRLAQ